MVVELVADVRDGRRDSSPSQLLRAVTPVLGRLLMVAVVAALLVTLGFVLLVVPGLILITVWSLAAPVIVVERPPGLAALGRSRELVRGNGWRVFGVILLLDVLVAVIAGAIEAGTETAGAGAGLVATVVVGILTAPISALAAAVMYFDLSGATASTAERPPQAQADPFGGP